jgi:hypothetical protein
MRRNLAYRVEMEGEWRFDLGSGCIRVGVWGYTYLDDVGCFISCPGGSR